MSALEKRHDLALLLLRLAVGGLMVLHGYHKLVEQGFDPGLADVSKLLAAHGLPKALAIGVYVGEVLAPLLLIVGWLVRPAGLAVVVTMVMSIWLQFGDDWYTRTDQGGLKVELNLLYLVGALVLVLVGGGRFALPKPLPRRNAE
ncbi:MAG: DoxX family protein [Planctomycetes bacterium]|nr:DoxX family protein [Planctomycetota bacterium]